MTKDFSHCKGASYLRNPNHDIVSGICIIDKDWNASKSGYSYSLFSHLFDRYNVFFSDAYRSSRRLRSSKVITFLLILFVTSWSLQPNLPISVRNNSIGRRVHNVWFERTWSLKHHITPNLLFNQRGGEASFSNQKAELSRLTQAWRAIHYQD